MTEKLSESMCARDAFACELQFRNSPNIYRIAMIAFLLLDGMVTRNRRKLGRFSRTCNKMMFVQASSVDK